MEIGATNCGKWKLGLQIVESGNWGGGGGGGGPDTPPTLLDAQGSFLEK